MEIYDIVSLVAIIASLRKRSSFILDTYFGGYVGPTGDEEIAFDIEEDVLGVAPFVSPYVEGKPVRERGFQTKKFAPAYVKPKMPLDPRKPLRRQFGEQLTGNLTPAQREEARVAIGFNDLLSISYRRLELMGAQAITTGKLIVTGEGYDTVELDFGRKPEFTQILAGAARWGEANVSPIEDLEDWIQEVAEESGVQPDKITMTRDAFRLFRDDPLFEKMIDIESRGTTASLDPALAKDVQQGVLVGTLGADGPEIWVYNSIYKDEQGVIQRVLPDYCVILGSSAPEANQTRHFGTVIDPELGYSSEALTDPETGAIMEFAPKTWVTKDPAQRFLMVQSAPLMALTRPNATMCKIIRS